MARTKNRRSKRNGKDIGQPSVKIKKTKVPKHKPTDSTVPVPAQLNKPTEATGSSSALGRSVGVSLGKERKKEKLSGFIFMCSSSTKPDCYQYRVFGLPMGKMDVVEKIKPGTKLFLYDFELKLLYGTYEATSAAQLNLEPAAFRGKFPVQVRFRIFKECLPLHESSLRYVIKENYRGSKFDQELSGQQVSNLLSSFHPLTTSKSQLTPARPTLSNIPRSQAMPRAITEDQLKYTSRMHAVEGPRLAAMQYGHALPFVRPQVVPNVLFPQRVGPRTAAYVSRIHPNSDNQGLPISSNYYVANARQPYFSEGLDHQLEDSYSRYWTMPEATHHVQGSGISHDPVTGFGREHHQSSLPGRLPYQGGAPASYVSTLMQPQVSAPLTLQGSSSQVSSNYYSGARWISR